MKTSLEPSELIKYKTYFSRDFLDFISGIKQRLRSKYDLVIAITGEEGVSKSCLGIWLGFLLDDNFNIEKNVAYLPSSLEIKDKFNSLKRFSVLDIDESCRGLNKKKWHDKLQQDLVDLYTTERFRNICSLVLMPRFKDFTESFRNHRIKIWIHILHRTSTYAQAVVYVRDDDKDCEFPWHQKENYKLKLKKFRGKKVSERRLSDKLTYERRTTNYLLDFKYPKLPEEIEKAYDYLKLESRKKIKSVEDERIGKTLTEKWKNSLIKAINYIIKSNPKFTQGEVANLVGLSQQTISKVIKKNKENQNI